MISGWWAGTSEEFMNIGGPFGTRDEAIKEGRHEQPGDPFWICEATLHEWSAPSASEVLDMLCDNADEYFYDDGFPGFDGPADNEKEMEKDLQTVLNDWFARWKHVLPTPTAFAGSTPPEQIDAPIAEETSDAD